MDRRLFSMLGALLLLASCGDDFKPETLVEGLRILGMRAEPAELRPGQTASLEALVVNGARPSTVLWLGCDPDPLDLGRSACSDPNVLANPAALPGDSDSTGLPPGMHVIGINDHASYAVPADLFSQLPAGDRRREVGTVAQVLAFAIDEQVDPAATREQLQAVLARVRSKDVGSELSLFRIRVSDQPGANRNPELGSLEVDGVVLPRGAAIRVEEGAQAAFNLTAPPGAFEDYVQQTPEGPAAKTEKLIVAWYATTGQFSEPRITVGGDTAEVFDAKPSGTDSLPEDHRGTAYAVVRDTRGGQTWERYPLYLCNRGLEAPQVTTLSPVEGPVDGTGLLTLQGSSLNEVVDVLVGDQVLLRGTSNGDGKRYQGQLPPLPAGDYPLTLRGADCVDRQVGTFRVR